MVNKEVQIRDTHIHGLFNFLTSGLPHLFTEPDTLCSPLKKKKKLLGQVAG